MQYNTIKYNAIRYDAKYDAKYNTKYKMTNTKYNAKYNTHIHTLHKFRMLQLYTSMTDC